MEKKIVVQWTKAEIERNDVNSQLSGDDMRVIESNHPKYVVGYRFDFGFLQIASREGYTIEIRPKAE